MDDEATSTALAEVRDRVVTNGQRRLREEIALRLLVDKGSVTDKQIDKVLAEEWQGPSGQKLADDVATKCAAAVNHLRDRVQVARDAVASVEGKVTKYEDLLQQVREQLVTAQEAADQEAADLAQQQALLEAALAAGGTPNITGEAATAAAGAATASAKTGKDA